MRIKWVPKTAKQYRKRQRAAFDNTKTTKRCMARYVPQSWVNDNAVEIDGIKLFDITKQVKKMGKEESLMLMDDTLPTDNLAIEAGLTDWTRGGRSGPFKVEVENAIRTYWEV